MGDAFQEDLTSFFLRAQENLTSVVLLLYFYILLPPFRFDLRIWAGKVSTDDLLDPSILIYRSH
jgi:hypothetical protein